MGKMGQMGLVTKGNAHRLPVVDSFIGLMFKHYLTRFSTLIIALAVSSYHQTLPMLLSHSSLQFL